MTFVVAKHKKTQNGMKRKISRFTKEKVLTIKFYLKAAAKINPAGCLDLEADLQFLKTT